MKHLFDNSAFEQEEENKNLRDYYEVNEDECYEFGGTSEDKHTKKSLLQHFKESMPFLIMIAVFCIGVFYYAFHR